ncbi:MAG TPA: hypothetical protein VGE50_00065 [Gammaproteobacteria bacterium]
MITLNESLKAWGSPAFNQCFKAEIEQLPADELPLQQGLSLTSYVSDEPFNVTVLAASDEPNLIHVKAGAFYSGIIAGCSCEDDPTPMSTIAEHCELQFDIDKRSGATTVTLLPS